MIPSNCSRFTAPLYCIHLGALSLAGKQFVDRKGGTQRILNINAWNEWTEGSYLEPDTTHKMEYLKVVRDVFRS